MVRNLRMRVLDDVGNTVAATHARNTKDQSKQAVIAKPAPKKRTAKPKQSAPKQRPKAASKRKLVPHRNPIPAPEPLPNPGKIDAPPYLPPKNPQANFLGLPAELRLQIYAYLNISSLIHVHVHQAPPTCVNRYAWTPCKAAHPAYPLLCANPKWSGLCSDADRCTVKIDKPLELRGPYALAATSKFVRGECMESFLTKAVVSVNLADVAHWARWLQEKAPRQLASIRRLTVAGPNGLSSFVWDMPEVKKAFPHIEALCFQLQTPNWMWLDEIWHPPIENAACWKDWEPIKWLTGRIFNDGRTDDQFGRHVTLIVEGTICVKEDTRIRRMLCRAGTEQQLVIRIVREGKPAAASEELATEPTGWSDEDVKIEVLQPGGLVEPKRNALWREWWRGKETKGFA